MTARNDSTPILGKAYAFNGDTQVGYTHSQIKSIGVWAHEGIVAGRFTHVELHTPNILDEQRRYQLNLYIGQYSGPQLIADEQ